MKVLVTGSDGFIGTNLCEELRTNGYDIYPYTWEKDGDLTKPFSFSRIAKSWQPDVVIHLAAQVGRLFGEDDVIHTVRANALMTTLVAKCCGEIGARLMYASTSEIYGDYGENYAYEYMQPKLPHNLYGLTKRWGEEVCELYAPAGLVHLRFSMPYGPGVVPGRGRASILNMLWQAHNRMPIPVHKGAERSWCWIGDTVRAVRMILESNQTGPFNVGRSDRPVTMLTVAHQACDIAGSDGLALIEEVDAPAAQTVVKRLATMKLEQLGWKPTVELREGMERLYEWAKLFDADSNPIAA